MSRPTTGGFDVRTVSEPVLDALVRIQVRAGQVDAAVAMIATYVTPKAST